MKEPVINQKHAKNKLKTEIIFWTWIAATSKRILFFSKDLTKMKFNLMMLIQKFKIAIKTAMIRF